MPLTDLKAKRATATDKPLKLFDGGGMFLHVTPSGGKVWRLKYRYGGKEKLLTIGPYPEVSLAKARRRREEARIQLEQGEDPAERKQAAKEARALALENTFEAVALEWLARKDKEGLADSTMTKHRWLLDMAFQHIGNIPITDVKAPQIMKALKAVESRGILETAKKLKGTVTAVMRYAVINGLIDGDPTPALKGALIPPKVVHRAAITDPAKLGALLRAIDGFEGQASTKRGLQLLALLFPRPGELRLAEWSEFDLENSIWEVPACRMKMRRPHRVPLPQPAIAILREQHIYSGHGRYVFPAVHTMQKPMSENTLNGALRRLGYTGDEMTAHGFRASFSTIANEFGKWHPDAIERALAHVEENQIRAAYARAQFWDERIKMAKWWGKYLAKLKIMTPQ